MLDKQDTIEKKYFTIGEVAEKLNVTPSLIRFWEKEFPVLKPRKTEGGTRKFSQQDVEILTRIYQLVKMEGYTLSGAREKLREKSGNVEEVKVKLTALRNFLIEINNQL